MRLLLALATLAALVAPTWALTEYSATVQFVALKNSTLANTATPFDAYAFINQTSATNTIVSVHVKGLQAGKSYGLHVHNWGDLSEAVNGGSFDTLTKVGGHFNPAGVPHGCQGVNSTRHAGDVGNITIPADWTEESYEVDLVSELLDLGRDTIKGNSIVGRAMVIHELVDTCQDGVFLGNWVGVGVIGIANVTSGDIQAATQDLAATVYTEANVLVFNTTGGGGTFGNVRLSTDPATGRLRLSGSVTGFAPNTEYGLHIHEFANEVIEPVQGFGPHYGTGAGGRVHALPPQNNRHWGDLGNVTSGPTGVITFDAATYYNTEFVSLWLTSSRDSILARSANNLIGRGLVIHEKADNGSTASFGARPAAGVIGLANPTTTAATTPASAHAVLHPFFLNTTAAFGKVTGAAIFQQAASGGDVSVTLSVRGLRPGSYAVHIHQYGDLSDLFNRSTGQITSTQASALSVGGHWDVTGTNSHGCQGTPNSATRHTGDLGNIVVAAGATADTVTTFTLSSELLDLGVNDRYNNDSIIGRAIVLHTMADPCSGTAFGSWLAVGVIGINNQTLNAAQQDTLPRDTNANVVLFNPQNVAVGELWLQTHVSTGEITATGVIAGFVPGSTHGMHIHVYGNTENALWSGPHYSSNSYYMPDAGHGLPTDNTRHWGDLGNVTANAQGVVAFNDSFIHADLLSIWNLAAHGIIGRTLTIHQNADTGATTSYQGRIAYGVIGIANPRTNLYAEPINVIIPETPITPGASSSGLPSTSTGGVTSNTGADTAVVPDTGATNANTGSGGQGSTAGTGSGSAQPTNAPSSPPNGAATHVNSAAALVIATVASVAAMLL